MRKRKELDEAYANLSRLLQSDGSELVHDRRLERARREIDLYRRGGKQSEDRLELAVKLMSEIAVDAFLKCKPSHDE